jgi:hypothetical protein
MASRGVESPDRADALIGSVMLGIGSNPYALYPNGQEFMAKELEKVNRTMESRRTPFAVPYVDFSRGW